MQTFIQLTVDTLKGANIVPDSAVQRGAPGTFVYLVKPDNTVTAQAITLGPDDGTKVAVLKGLEPGQVIVTDGADRLKEGAKITVTENASGQPPAPEQGAAQPAAGHGRHQGHGKGQGPGAAPQGGQPAAPGGQNGSGGG